MTGAFGCIGSWAVRLLLDEGCGVTTYDLGGSDHRLRLLLDDAELAGLDRVAGDVTDLAQLRGTMEDRDVTHLIHLAALQVPFVRADPPLGARVNVVGTVTVFEAVRAAPLTGTLSYASSIAAYDPPEPGHEHEQRGVPSTLYGVFKRANEETAGVYWADHGIPSVGLRPHTVYGLGRDQGVTSAPTKAMLAAAAGSSYRIPYGGRAEMQHARDVARQFIAAARAEVKGAVVLDPPGQPTSIAEVVDAITAAVPEAAGAVGFDDVVSMGVPEQGDTASFVSLLGDLPTISLRDGVAETIESFRGLLARGLVKPEAVA
ncbi:MAG: NAD(P)-dependent oxidoreductase [Actinomycetota bacterium]|nr:NAD(P)-dependent oxidoreductase [Actinomycetota bacterium]